MPAGRWWEAVRREVAPLLRPKLQRYDALVISVSGGKAKVAILDEPTDPAQNGRPHYPVVGAAPVVGERVLFLADAFGGVVVTGGSGGGGVTDHGALTGLSDDDHPQYVLDTELSAHVTAPDPHAQYVLDSDLTAHTGASDPHTQYQKESEKNAAGGYLGIRTSPATPDPTKVAAGTPNGSKYLRDDMTWQAVAGGASMAAVYAPADAADTQSFPNNTYKIIPMGAPTVNNLGTVNTTTNRWTPGAAGTYICGAAAAIEFSTVSTSSQFFIEVWKNGVFDKFIASVHAGSARNLVVSGVVPVVAANSTDYFEIWGNYRTSGSAGALFTDFTYFTAWS